MFLPTSNKSIKLPFMVILCHDEQLLPLLVTSFSLLAQFFWFFVRGGGGCQAP